MKVLHLVTDIGRVSSGLCQVAGRLPVEMQKLIPAVEVLTVAPGSAFELGDVLHVASSPMSRGLLPIRLWNYAAALRDLTTDDTIVHLHGLWTLPNLGLAVLSEDHWPKHLVVSPHGTLTEWALSQSKLKKRLAWTAFQRNILNRADCIHVTSQSECDDVRRVGVKTPVCIIPNGVDIPSSVSETTPAPRDGSRKSVVLSLGRLHEKKGLDVLLHAWKELGPQTDGWELRIVGPMEGAYANQLYQFVTTNAMENVRFPGEVRGRDKWVEYEQADVFVLPSWSENFGLVVAEALAHRVPVIATHGTPWEGLDSNGCGWWVRAGKEGIRDALAAAVNTDPATRREMGLRGREWATTNFSWSGMAEALVDVYRWVTLGGAPPDGVRSCP